MGSQKQSHRARELTRMLETHNARQTQTINNLIEQNHRLVEKVAWHENRPPWWKLSECRKWREAGQ